MAVSIDGYLIDAAETETLTFESDVTEDETESGQNFTDNIKNRADVVSIKGIVTDTPIGDMVRVRAEASAAGLDEDLPFLPSDEAQARLLKIHTGTNGRPRPITVQTSRGLFENMALTALEINTDSETGDALFFTASFRKIRIVANELVVIRVAAPQLGPKVKKTGVPVQVVPGVVSPGGGDPHTSFDTFTKTGKKAVWNPAKGRFEYADNNGNASGRFVPNSDLSEPVLGQDPVGDPVFASGSAGKAHFDDSKGQWLNPDGTPATLKDRNASGANKTLPDPARPWYHPTLTIP